MHMLNITKSLLTVLQLFQLLSYLQQKSYKIKYTYDVATINNYLNVRNFTLMTALSRVYTGCPTV